MDGDCRGDGPRSVGGRGLVDEARLPLSRPYFASAFQVSWIAFQLPSFCFRHTQNPAFGIPMGNPAPDVVHQGFFAKVLPDTHSATA